MTNYSFTLIIDGDVDGRLDALFEAGCDDATFGEVDGVHYADFDRTSDTLADALATAVHQVESIPGIKVRRVEPDDLVTAAEIANRLKRTRESVRLLIAKKRGKREFPAPVSHLRKRTRFWRWSDVAAWAGAESGVLSEARLVAALNATLEFRETVLQLPERERSLFASLSR